MNKINDQRREFRIVGSMTTLPSRLFVCLKVIKSLLNQTFPLDAIYLNLPYITSKGKTYHITPELESLVKQYPKIIINRCIDEGPITKLLPTLEYERDPTTRIITWDDDVLVSSDTVNVLVNKTKQYPQSALSFSGWCVGNMPFPYQIVIGNSEDVECDWIQGVHAIIYPREILDADNIRKFRQAQPPDIRRLLFLNDDHWISGYLESINVKKFSIGFLAKEYFTDLFTEAHISDSISNRKEFIKEVYQIGEHFREIGIYRRSYQIIRSVAFPILCLGVVAAISIITTRPFIHSVPEFILVNLLIIYASFRIILIIAFKRHLLPKIIIPNNY